ncbi:MAG: hypothetical protein HXN20_01410 [Porphyromonas sp.]|uniref:hypothetical protein n=1 Tax=Porphyromonas sp. TaxID=1924944 RepID=UPI001CAD272C|nr:hypothetical protein [Porphyromonas sp.]MBF1274579.1 hypothetical protein [Porphyromonadaceae bacterium]MBF1412699.1 hypothetical protein [Porphyromonas sp.]
MKRFTTLLLLAFGAILGLSACSSEPETDALTSTVWTIPNLTTTSGGTTTTIDVTISFIRKGQASIEVGYGEFTQNLQDGGSQNKKRELSATMSTSYVYRNGVVHLNRPTYSSHVGQSIKGTEVETIINRLEADAAVDIQAGTMTFNPTDNAKRFTAHLKSKK